MIYDYDIGLEELMVMVEPFIQAYKPPLMAADDYNKFRHTVQYMVEVVYRNSGFGERINDDTPVREIMVTEMMMFCEYPDRLYEALYS